MRGGLTCYLHPEAAAGDRCSKCNRTICPVCVVEVEHRTLCRSCADRASARRGRIKRAAVAGLLTASAGTLWFLFLRSAGDRDRADEPRADAGVPAEMLAEMETMRGRLRADPCDIDAAWHLGGLQNALGDYPATLAMVDRTVARCGGSPALYQTSLYALEKTNDWDRAVALTSELVAEDPEVPDYWAWRGDALAGKGELEQAAFDYRQSLALRPNNAVVKFAELARKRGRPCEGVFAVSRFIDLVATTRAWVHDMRHDLYIEGDCGPRLGRGSGRLRAGERMRAAVGGASGNFVVSDDLPHIVVTRAFAARAGLAVAETPAITILLDGGLKTAAVAEVSRVEIGQLSATGFEAAVVDAIAGVGKQPTDGVIGLDFFWRFESVWQDGKMALEPLRIAL